VVEFSIVLVYCWVTITTTANCMFSLYQQAKQEAVTKLMVDKREVVEV
jgi:hypothetical protein